MKRNGNMMIFVFDASGERIKYSTTIHNVLYMNANWVRDCVVLIHLYVIVFVSLCALISCPKGTWLMIHFLSSCLYGIATRWIEIACTDYRPQITHPTGRFHVYRNEKTLIECATSETITEYNQQPKKHTHTHRNVNALETETTIKR